MIPKAPGAASTRMVESLARVARRHPLERKLILAPTRSAGRELLRRLALGGRGWMGFEITTPRPLALRLARAVQGSADLHVLDPFDSRALLDEAMDYALRPGDLTLGALSEGVGLRERVHGAVEALRLADVRPALLEKARLSDGQRGPFLKRTLERYERLLAARHRMDTADVFRAALTALDAEGSKLPTALGAEVVVLMPGLGTRGLPGRLVGALTARGAKVLETEPVVGLDTPEKLLWKPAKEAGLRSYLHAPGEAPAPTDAPPIELFRAASVTDELREVLRRIRAADLRWDQVEIVTPDPAVYGSALHAVASNLGIPVTYAVGLPIARTRTGRVVRVYLDWIQDGFQADPIRRLLEAGDLRPPRARGGHAPAALARRFRSLRIGWGRSRYREQIRGALAGVDRLEAGRYETDGGFERRRARMTAELEALRSILFPALKATPAVPDRAGEERRPVSPAEIARGLRAFLRRVPRGRGPDLHAREEVERVLERVEATLVRRTSFAAAVTVLRRHLELRVRGVGSAHGDEVAPWSSAGGHLHLSDVEHGGFTGREAVFVVGLDADRAPGFESQDPVMLDGDRRVLSDELPTSLELTRERAFRFAALFARLPGSVTLSYCAWSALDARVLAPSPVLLQAVRLRRADPALTFSDLDAALGRVVCAVPRPGSAALDGDDAWMRELGRGEILAADVEAVSVAYPRLATGRRARRALGGVPGPGHGVVTPRPDDLDPRRNPSLVVSASRLEALGACPLRYLHASVLRIRPPDDPELDPDRWLDHLRRGSLLHAVFEATLRRARDEGVAAEEPRFEEVALEALADGILRMGAEMPLPGEGALRRERSALAADVRSFVRMVREEGAPWIALELAFGLGDDEPATLDLAGRALRLRGAIDRVDEDLHGLRVVDYKTGVVRDEGAAAFKGGRRLQHAIYARVAESRLRREVVTGEYHYPTIRGENRRLPYDRMQMAAVGDLLGHMLDGVAAGAFVPTDDADDCTFCDYAEVCRVRRSGRGKASSALAEWSAEQVNTGLWPAFASLKRTRTFED